MKLSKLANMSKAPCTVISRKATQSSVNDNWSWLFDVRTETCFCIFCQRTAHVFPMLYYGTAPSPPQNCPFPWGDSEQHLIHSYWGQSHPTRQVASRFVQLFSYNTSAWPTTDSQTDPSWTSRSIGPGFQPSVGSLNLRRVTHLLHSVSSSEQHRLHDRNPECCVRSTTVMRCSLYHYNQTQSIIYCHWYT